MPRHPGAAADFTTFGQHLMERISEHIHSATFARVVTFAATSAAKPFPTASVRPLIPRWRDDAGPIYPPQLDDVPVLFLGSRGFRIDWALADGDFVLVLFLDRPIDAVLVQLQWPQALDPQRADPLDPRTHDLADAVAIPIGTFGRPAPPHPPMVAPPATIQVDLLNWCVAVMSALEAATTPAVPGGPAFEPATIANLAALRAQIEGVR